MRFDGCSVNGHNADRQTDRQQTTAFGRIEPPSG